MSKERTDKGALTATAPKQTHFVWDGSRLLQEYNYRGSYSYIYTDQDSYEPLAQIFDNAKDGKQYLSYFHNDQIGIPREMTDQFGNLLWYGEYTAWGRLKTDERVYQHAHQPFRLQNQYCDEETGLHYNLFRYYEPDCGRFVNQDPIGLWGGDNLYFFAPNVQDWIDPLGESGYRLRISMQSQGMYRPNSSWQTHHLIPQAVWRKKKKFLNEIGMKGKGLGRDSWTNGLYMPSTEGDAKKFFRRFFHRGSHKNYNKMVLMELDKIEHDFRAKKISAEQAHLRVRDLQKDLAKRLKALPLSCGKCGFHKRLD